MGRNHSHKKRASNSTMFPSAENHFVIRPGAGIDKLQARIPTSGTNSGYTDPTKMRLSIDQKIDQSAIDRINAFRRPAQGPAYVPPPPPANQLDSPTSEIPTELVAAFTTELSSTSFAWVRRNCCDCDCHCMAWSRCSWPISFSFRFHSILIKWHYIT